ncbi:hypothetical protein BX666DRAFT_1869263 [Dichotomocladium elegans]|nr:hypothetical protein BX666DRAFT_1869263 [Dichotomocladium elegans]
MSQIRTKLMGNVLFHDRKIKWNRITLQLTGRAGLDVQVPALIVPNHEGMSTTHVQTSMTVCEVEKELIFTGAPSIDFGFHLPIHLPPSIKAKHAFVDYTLVASFVRDGSTSFNSKKQKVQRTVTVKRHYLPGPAAVIPSVEHHGVRDWFEWSVEVPKAVAIESGELVAALRWSVEKEWVEVDRIEFAIEEQETYRFSTKTGVHNLPPVPRRFPSTTYHPPTFATSSETHFIRAPLTHPALRTHHFDPFLEISHRCQMAIHFSSTQTEPLVLTFPIIITDFPANPTTASALQISPEQPQQLVGTRAIPTTGGDDAIQVDLDLPEYTPRYEQVSA